MRFLTAMVLWALGLSVYAQQVVVKDSLSGEPISGVIIYNESRSAFTTTGSNGQAELDRFAVKEWLFFRHMGHGVLKRLKSTIENGETLYLSSQSEGLDEIVISASRFAEVARKLPVRVRKIGDQEIALTQPQTAADLLQNTGAVFVQKSQLGGGSPMIRGFATNRVLITVDGIRMNNAIFRGGNIQNVISIDPFTLERAEVLYGPGTVISGSDAIGGVMNFYTRELEELESANETLQQTDYALRMATAASERTVHVSHKVISPKFAGVISFSRMSVGDLKMGSNGPDSYLRTFYVETEGGVDRVVQNEDPQKQVGSGFDSYHFMAKGRHRISKEWHQQLGLFFNTTSDFGRYDRLIQTRKGLPRSAEWYYGPQQWLLTYYKLTQEAEKTRHQFSAAYQRFNESRFDRAFGDPVLNEALENVGVINVSLDAERILSENSLFRYGVALDHN
ncbi:MAG: TonB-dependent receptor, partial [Flavobacteriaceae bacterium]